MGVRDLRRGELGRPHVMEFSAVVEDEPKEQIDVWVYDGQTIQGYSDHIKRLARADRTSLFGFVEGRDGFLYAVVNRPGLPHGIGRIRVSGRGSTMALIGEFPANTDVVFPGTGAGLLGDIGGNPFINPSGQVYFLIQDTPASAWPLGNRNRRYMRLTGTSLVLDVSVPQVIADWEDFVFSNPPPVLDPYFTTNRPFPTERDMLQAILQTGEWVAADPIPSFEVTGNQELFNPEDRGPHFTNALQVPEGEPGSENLRIGVRVWGNAWWRRPGGAGAWLAVTNDGLSSATTRMGLETIPGGGIDLHEQPAQPSVHFSTRVNRTTGGNILPTTPHNRRFRALGFTQVGPMHNNVPWQTAHGMISDRTHLYYIGRAEQSTTDAKGPYTVKVDINRTPIPQVGQTPGIWSVVVPRTDFTGPDFWAVTGVAVTKRWIWVAEQSLVTDRRRLRAYSKDGVTFREVRNEPLGVGGFTLTAGFRARWK